MTWCSSPVHDGAGWSPRGTGDVQLTRNSSGDLFMDEFREVLCHCYVVHSPLVVLSRRSVRWRAQLCTDDEPVEAHVLLCVSEELPLPVPGRLRGSFGLAWWVMVPFGAWFDSGYIFTAYSGLVA